MRFPDRVRLWTTLAATTSAIAAATPAAIHAQAFGISEIGSCAVGRGFAVTASPCKDASAIYWNPAATTQLNGWNITAGGAAIIIKGAFKQDTTGRKWDGDVPNSYIPHVFLNYHSPTSDVAWGVGVYVPYGLTSQWTTDFPGRFSALKASLATIYVQPNVAWKFNSKWSIGGGPIFGHSTVELRQGVDLATTPTGSVGPDGKPVFFGQLGIASGTEFARVKLKGSSTAYGAQIAIAGQPTDHWSVGARFLTPLEFSYDNADATFQPIPTNLTIGGTLPGTPFVAGTPVDAIVAGQFTGSGALVAQKASTKITHPAQIQGGAAYSGYKNWLLEADYAWVGWKRFASLPVNFTNTALNKVLIEDYNNTSTVRLGAEYTTAMDGWKLRGGFMGVASAAPPETVTPLLPEQDRMYWTFGVGIPIMKTWALDAGYAHVSTPGARGRIVERTSEAQTAAQLNTGVYTLSANIFALTLKATF